MILLFGLNSAAIAKKSEGKIQIITIKADPVTSSYLIVFVMLVLLIFLLFTSLIILFITLRKSLKEWDLFVLSLLL
jgi:hypothetical protein